MVVGEKLLLILVDGTWAQARHIIRHSPDLTSACRRAMFATEVDSKLDAVRRQPASHCMCTLEAGAHALRELDHAPEAQMAVDYLEASLRELVQAQLRFAQHGTPRPPSANRRVLQRALAPQ
jgi:DTW domain-containing protein YfiP